jgi:hypothetical protein
MKNTKSETVAQLEKRLIDAERQLRSNDNQISRLTADYNQRNPKQVRLVVEQPQQTLEQRMAAALAPFGVSPTPTQIDNARRFEARNAQYDPWKNRLTDAQMAELNELK